METVSRQLENYTEAHIERLINTYISNETYILISDLVWTVVRDKIRTQVRNQVFNQVENHF